MPGIKSIRDEILVDLDTDSPIYNIFKVNNLEVVPIKSDYSHIKEYRIGTVKGISEYNYYHNLLTDVEKVSKTIIIHCLKVLESLPTPYWRLRVFLTILNLTRVVYVKDRFLHAEINEKLLTEKSVSKDIMSSPSKLLLLRAVAKS